MKILYLIFFASLISTSWCGLILRNLFSGLRPYGHSPYANQPNPVINIHNEQLVSPVAANRPVQYRPNVGYGSIKNGYSTGVLNYDSPVQVANGSPSSSSASASSSSLNGVASSSSSASSSSIGAGGSARPWNHRY